jgi:hypothetical protein
MGQVLDHAHAREHALDGLEVVLRRAGRLVAAFDLGTSAAGMRARISWVLRLSQGVLRLRS